MQLTDKTQTSSYLLFKASHRKVCEVCLKILLPENTNLILRYSPLRYPDLDSKEKYNPHIHHG